MIILNELKGHINKKFTILLQIFLLQLQMGIVKSQENMLILLKFTVYYKCLFIHFITVLRDGRIKVFISTGAEILLQSSKVSLIRLLQVRGETIKQSKLNTEQKFDGLEFEVA